MKYSSRFWFAVLAPLALAAFVGTVGGVTYSLAMVLNGDCSPLWFIPIALAGWATFSVFIYSTTEEERVRVK